MFNLDQFLNALTGAFQMKMNQGGHQGLQQWRTNQEAMRNWEKPQVGAVGGNEPISPTAWYGQNFGNYYDDYDWWDGRGAASQNDLAVWDQYGKLPWRAWARQPTVHQRRRGRLREIMATRMTADKRTAKDANEPSRNLRTKGTQPAPKKRPSYIGKNKKRN